jgi:hypothetical protein
LTFVHTSWPPNPLERNSPFSTKCTSH